MNAVRALGLFAAAVIVGAGVALWLTIALEVLL